VQAPPSRNAELKKLRTVISCDTGPAPADAIACPSSATAPAATLVPTMNGRIDASTRPTVSQYRTSAASKTMSAPKATRPVRSADASGGRNANAPSTSSAAIPELNLKNFTPASRETKTSVKAMPIARCARKRKRTNYRSRLLISAQLTTFHHASM